jgi:hypothetical protein
MESSVKTSAPELKETSHLALDPTGAQHEPDDVGANQRSNQEKQELTEAEHADSIGPGRALTQGVWDEFHARDF